MIKNIIFDLSEVIISGYYGVEKVVGKNTEIPSEIFLNRKIETRSIFLDAMRGKYTEDQYLRLFLKDTNWNLSIDKLKLLIRENLNIPVEGTMDIVKSLKNNYTIILLSDHIKEWMEYILEKNKDLSIFENQYFSYQYNKLKTDDGTFDIIINDLNIKPEETIFIDDAERNVQCAQKSGIKGIVFKNSNQLREELHKLNVL